MLWHKENFNYNDSLPDYGAHLLLYKMREEKSISGFFSQVLLQETLRCIPSLIE